MKARAFALALSARRRKLGWSKRRAARVMGVNLATYIRWEGRDCAPAEVARQSFVDLLDAAIRIEEKS